MQLILTFLCFTISIQTLSAQQTCQTPEPDEIGGFMKLSAISKYFYFESRVENSFSYTYDQANDMCKHHNLVMAEVTSLTDLNSLKPFLSNSQDHYWLGLSDWKTEGDFVESDGITKIKFQAFSSGNPDNGDGDEDCVQIIYEEGRIFMDDVDCGSTAGVLCQFAQGSYCHINSYQQNVGDERDLVHLAGAPNFYVSTVQKSRIEAYRSCLSHRKYLVSFTEKEWNDEMMKEMRFYEHSADLDIETTYWTSGTLLKDDMGRFNGIVYWEVFDEEYDYITNAREIEFKWGQGEPNSGQLYNSDIKDCLDVSYEMMDQPSAVPVWRASNCLLPKFYVCMDLNITVPMNRGNGDGNGGGSSGNGTGTGNGNDKNGTVDCETMNSKTVAPPAINLLKPFTVDQTLDLMLFALKNDLNSGMTKIQEKGSISWKRTIIELIFNIFKKGVSTDYVPHGLLNVAQEINMIYQNAVTGADKSVNSEGWAMITPILKTCLSNVPQLPFTAFGMKIKFYNQSTSDNLISVPQEHADLYTNLDMSLDVLWYVFSFSLGICYHVKESGSSIWASQYYIMFSLDFIEKLEDKWAMPDDANILKQSLIFGNEDIFTAMDNLRAATTAAYLRNRIIDRQVVRPISIEKLNGEKVNGSFHSVNFKTGMEFN